MFVRANWQAADGEATLFYWQAVSYTFWARGFFWGVAEADGWDAVSAPLLAAG